MPNSAVKQIRRVYVMRKDNFGQFSIKTYEPPHDKTNKMASPSEDSDQPWHSSSLIRVIAVCMKSLWLSLEHTAKTLI